MAFPIDPFHLLAPRARIGAASAVVDLRSGEPYEVVGAGETTPDPPAAPLVVLRRADRNAHSEPLPLGEPAPDDETRVAVACFDGDEARWLDATLEARPPSPGELRSGLVFDPPREFDIEVAALLAGAPVALGSRIVGIVARAALPRFGSQAAYVQVVESPQVRELLARATALGGSEQAQSKAEPEPAAAAEPVQRIMVRVVYGDVRSARYVVLVGHYEGDSIVGPEQVLDRLLGGQLSQRRALGLYPGPIGTAALFLASVSPGQSVAPGPTGAMVVGLGRAGELTSAALVETLRRGLVQLAVELTDRVSGPDRQASASGSAAAHRRVRVYISSTFEDLRDERATVADALRSLGHDAIAMEDYAAGGTRAVERALRDVAACDLYVAIIGWRYGFVPHEGNPSQLSMLELEYREARKRGLPTLVFLQGLESARTQYMDKVTGENERGERIEHFRAEISKQLLVSQFASAEDLRSQATAAVVRAVSEMSGEDVRPAQEAGFVGVSSLLVGAGGHGVEVEDAASALIDAVLGANASLAGSGRRERFVELEVIEIGRQRATDALASLRALAERKGRRDGLAVEAELAQGRGGAAAEDEVPEGDGWRGRLQVTQSADGGLRFVMLRRRTRAEAAVGPEGVRLADDLLRRTVGAGRIEPGVWPTLSELLIPESARPGVRREDLLLLVDERAARYPWELVLDAGEQGRPPYCVERQLIRQMVVASFRQAVAAFGEAALVIGPVRTADTKAFSPLPGARAEAEMVAKTLSARLKVETLIESEAEDVVSRLFAMPYRLLHMSGYGVQRSGYERADVVSPMVGLVLSDSRALTPVEIQQMRAIPELVFVSCGYAPTHVELDTFAAKMAADLIGAGVRAVVVAGWTVDDAAALTFTRRFYLQLLDGAPLGEAVRLARAETWERHRESHTWGAYQCYGDPEYRLFPETRAAA